MAGWCIKPFLAIAGKDIYQFFLRNRESITEATKHQAMAQKMLRMPPDRAAEIIVRAVERNQARVLVGLDAKVLALLERLMPVKYWRLLGRGAGM